MGVLDRAGRGPGRHRGGEPVRPGYDRVRMVGGGRFDGRVIDVLAGTDDIWVQHPDTDAGGPRFGERTTIRKLIYTRHSLPPGIIVDEVERQMWSDVTALFLAADVEVVTFQLLDGVIPADVFDDYVAREIGHGMLRWPPLTPVWRENVGPPDVPRAMIRWRWFTPKAGR